jgi:hypothetical protein
MSWLISGTFLGCLVVILTDYGFGVGDIQNLLDIAQI